MIDMPSDHPQTPQSPSQTSPGPNDPPSKPTTSPRVNNSLPTPAHSINGSMASAGSVSVLDATHPDEESNKRKRDLDDQGDQEQKKVHVEDSRISIDDLHLDVGKKYLLCRTRKTPFFSKNRIPHFFALGLFFMPESLHITYISTWLTPTLMNSSSCQSSSFYPRSLRALFTARDRFICSTNWSRRREEELAQDVQELHAGTQRSI